jgi:DNA gyrase/topoisomerase IV subunit B
MISTPFAEAVELDGQKFEWAITWLGPGEDGFFHSYCNTVPTPSGGTHETGFRQAIVRGLRSFGDLVGNKKAADITADDALAGGAIMLSVFLRDPQFQGQTKDRLSRPMQPAKPNRPFVTGLINGCQPMPDVQHFCWMPRLSARMTANAAKKKKKLRGNRQQDVCAFRANWLIVRQAIMKQPNYSWSRVILLADRQNRHATGKFRRYYPFGVKS